MLFSNDIGVGIILDKKSLNKQYEHWEKTFSEHSEKFGDMPSAPAMETIKLLKKNIKIDYWNWVVDRAETLSTLHKTVLKSM